MIMGKNTSIILGDHFDQFIQDELKSGRYASASEVIRSGLRLMEIEKMKIEAINKALSAGESSGEPEKFDNDRFLERMRQKHSTDARNTA